MARSTIGRGLKDLDAPALAPGQVRRPGSGRKPVQESDATLLADLRRLVEPATTDPDARLYRKSPGTGAMLCFMGHTLMENRNGLIVQAELTRADGHAERQAALAMIQRLK